MANPIKQLYVSLYINEKELQVVAAEYFNTRFNIIRVDKQKIEGIINFKIVDQNKLVEIIKKTLNDASSVIGAKITKVILVIPPYNFRKQSLRVSVKPNGGILTKADIANAVSSSLKTEVDSKLVVVNSSIVKYNINGISSRRLSDKEVCDECIVDIDLLCADKEFVYSYVKAVSSAGVKILDITLDNYAIAKEAVLLEDSLSKNMVLLDIGYDYSYLSLFSMGKLVNTVLIYDGLNTIINNINTIYSIPFDTADRLIKYNVEFDSPNGDNAVYAWGDGKNNNSITINQLSNAVKTPLYAFIDKILTLCKPIVESGITSFFVVGEGAKMNTLVETLKKQSGCETRAYYPDTIGVRDSSLCAAFASFFVYLDKVSLNGLDVACIDLSQYEQVLTVKQLDNEGESITTKLRKLCEKYLKKENNDDNKARV